MHRNLGGLVNHKDLNVMSCLEYALHLGVKHVIVCGHYNCGTLYHHLCTEQPHFITRSACPLLPMVCCVLQVTCKAALVAVPA